MAAIRKRVKKEPVSLAEIIKAHIKDKGLIGKSFLVWTSSKRKKPAILVKVVGDYAEFALYREDLQTKTIVIERGVRKWELLPAVEWDEYLHDCEICRREEACAHWRCGGILQDVYNKFSAYLCTECHERLLRDYEAKKEAEKEKAAVPAFGCSEVTYAPPIQAGGTINPPFIERLKIWCGREK
jgi:hypothetical protein